MSEVVKVTALGQTYKHQGKGFGPFRGTPDRPFLEVPLAVALASGAPVYTGEPEPSEDDGDLASQVDHLTTKVKQLIDERNDLQFKLDHKSEIIERGMADNKRLADQAGASNENSFRLKGELDTVTAERDDLRAKLEEAFDPIAAAQQLSDELPALSAQLQADLRPLIEALNAGLPSVFDANTAAIQANTSALSTASQQMDAVVGDTPLPEDFPMRALLLQHGFDSLGKVRAGVADGKVNDISGIGPATLKTIEAALK